MFDLPFERCIDIEFVCLCVTVLSFRERMIIVVLVAVYNAVTKSGRAKTNPERAT